MIINQPTPEKQNSGIQAILEYILATKEDIRDAITSRGGNLDGRRFEEWGSVIAGLQSGKPNPKPSDPLANTDGVASAPISISSPATSVGSLFPDNCYVMSAWTSGYYPFDFDGKGQVVPKVQPTPPYDVLKDTSFPPEAAPAEPAPDFSRLVTAPVDTEWRSGWLFAAGDARFVLAPTLASGYLDFARARSTPDSKFEIVKCISLDESLGAKSSSYAHCQSDLMGQFVYRLTNLNSRDISQESIAVCRVFYTLDTSVPLVKHYVNGTITFKMHSEQIYHNWMFACTDEERANYKDPEPFHAVLGHTGWSHYINLPTLADIASSAVEDCVTTDSPTEISVTGNVQEFLNTNYPGPDLLSQLRKVPEGLCSEAGTEGARSQVNTSLGWLSSGVKYNAAGDPITFERFTPNMQAIYNLTYTIQFTNLYDGMVPA